MNTYQNQFDALVAASEGFAQTGAAERLDRIHALYGAIYEHRLAIAAASKAELAVDGRAQLVPIKAMLREWDQHLARWMEPVDIDQTTTLAERRGYVRYEPKGVVLHLSTWNAPILSSLTPVMSMLSAGNTVLLKPSEITPLSAAVIADIVDSSGCGDIVDVVQGGPEVGQELLELPFNHICYIGSNRVGRYVMEAAAKHFADVTLEMGGKNPVVVAPDVDVDEAARRIVNGRHILGGQTCLSPDYVLIHDSIYDELVAALRDAILAFYDPDGQGFRASSALARIVSENHTQRIGSLIDEAVEQGAKPVVGGEYSVPERFVEPTILEGVSEGTRLFHEETFGPVLTVHHYSDPEDAVAEIEKRPKPLGFYIFTQSRAQVDWYLAHSRAGSSAVNNIATQALVPNLPFGGVNHSGIGMLNGQDAFRTFSNARGVVEDALDPDERVPMFFPPFPEGLDMGAVLDPMLEPEPWP
jgi:aldehyde dehydrogenase (NAD+)